MRAAAVLVAYDSAAVLGQALASLPPDLPAVVVDNASRDASAEIAAAAGATVLRRPFNAGFGVANNEGWRSAEADWILFLNPDARLRPGALDALGAAAAMAADADILAPAIVTKGGISRKLSSPISAPAFRLRPAPAGLEPIDFASGAAFLMRRAALERLGGFDEAIFLYFEDDDLSRRVLDAGRAILRVPSAVVEHAGNVSSPPSAAMTYMKHWHLAWSERHVRLKFGLPAPGRWRIVESRAKLMLAQARGDDMEAAKQRGLIDGTRAHMRGARAQDVRDQPARRL